MPISLSNKKKLRNLLFIVIIIILLLTTRLGYIQMIWGPELSNMASSQQVQSRTITAKRGTIYDSTGKYILATSSSVETVSVNPTNIAEENKEKVARALCDIFELEYETVIKKIRKRSSIETIVKKVDKDTSELSLRQKEVYEVLHDDMRYKDARAISESVTKKLLSMGYITRFEKFSFALLPDL